MSSICLIVLSKAHTIPNASSGVVALPFDINLRRISLIWVPAISVSISCSSLSVYSQSLAMMRARVMPASTVSVVFVSRLVFQIMKHEAGFRLGVFFKAFPVWR